MSETASDRIVVTLDDLKAQRQRAGESEGSLTWLITFADLMMILLVFSFAMYITRGTDPLQGTRQAGQTRDGGFLMPVAYATADAPDMTASAPLFVPVTGRPAELPAPKSERIIRRDILQFAPDCSALTELHLGRLREIADLHAHNPSSSIIVSIAGPGAGETVHRRLDNLIDHLVTACGISREHIYIQHAAVPPQHSRASGALPDHTLDIRLSKSFWWF